MKLIEQILMSLHEKEARVKSSGLFAQGHTEGTVKLWYKQYHGLSMTSQLQWNNTPISKDLTEKASELRKAKDYDYEVMNAFQIMIEEYCKEAMVTIGQISPYNITRIDTIFDDNKENELRELTIHYKDGGKVNIRITL